MCQEPQAGHILRVQGGPPGGLGGQFCWGRGRKGSTPTTVGKVSRASGVPCGRGGVISLPKKITFQGSCALCKNHVSTMRFSNNWRCSGLTLQPCPCSSSDHGLTAAPSTSPGRPQPRAERNQATGPGVQGCSQSVTSARPPAPRGCSHSMIKPASPPSGFCPALPGPRLHVG